MDHLYLVVIKLILSVDLVILYPSICVGYVSNPMNLQQLSAALLAAQGLCNYPPNGLSTLQRPS